MKPKHVKRFEDSLSYPEYTEEDKKKGMNNKDLDFMAQNPMFWAVILPSIFVIGIGILPFITMFIFLTNQNFLNHEEKIIMAEYAGALLYKALQTKYKAEKAEAQANLEIYFTNKVGVAEHPNVVESMDKLMEQYANADEKLRILEEEF